MPSVGSQLSVVPSGLPLLPGNGFKDPTHTSFHKSHLFDFYQGISISQDTQPPAGPAPALKGSGTTTSFGMPTMPPRPLDPAEVTPVQPAWVAFDRKVLRFNCFFKESVNESRLENYRIRNCVLYYYLEDDSMHISEPKVENSGIPQGERKGTVFLKRHRVPKPEGGFYGVADLNVNQTIDLYGRVFLITDADNFTRTFMSKLGIEVPDSVSVPLDPYSETRSEMKQQIVRNQKYFHPRTADDDLIRMPCHPHAPSLRPSPLPPPLLPCLTPFLPS